MYKIFSVWIEFIILFFVFKKVKNILKVNVYIVVYNLNKFCMFVEGGYLVKC